MRMPVIRNPMTRETDLVEDINHGNGKTENNIS
jgi:hypothetical protein